MPVEAFAEELHRVEKYIHALVLVQLPKVGESVTNPALRFIVKVISNGQYPLRLDSYPLGWKPPVYVSIAHICGGCDELIDQREMRLDEPLPNEESLWRNRR